MAGSIYNCACYGTRNLVEVSYSLYTTVLSKVDGAWNCSMVNTVQVQVCCTR
jgi:hypothetical protein